MDLAITGGQIVTEAGRYLADIGIRTGQIAVLAAPGSLPAAAESGRFVRVE